MVQERSITEDSKEGSDNLSDEDSDDTCRSREGRKLKFKKRTSGAIKIENHSRDPRGSRNFARPAMNNVNNSEPLNLEEIFKNKNLSF